MSDEKAQVSSDKEPKPPKPSNRPPKAEKPARKAQANGVGLFTVLVFSALAAAAGTIGGAVLSDRFAEEDKSPDVTASLDDIRATQSSLKAQVSRLEASVKAQKPDTQSAQPGAEEIEELILEFEALEARVSDLTNAEYGARIAALEAGTVQEGREIDISTLPDLMARIDALEARPEPIPSNSDEQNTVDISGLTARLDALEAVEAPAQIDLAPIRVRLRQLETRLNTLENTRIVALPDFPRDAVLEALRTDESGESRNWFQRTIDKQITIRDEESIKTVDAIMIRVAQGDSEGAIALLETLPQDAQAAARAWVNQVKEEE